MKLYEIDVEKSEPQYWYNTVKDIIKQWYANNEGTNKTLGFKWLREDIVKNTQLSESFVTDLINNMADNNHILKITTKANTVYFTLDELNVNKSIDNK